MKQSLFLFVVFSVAILVAADMKSGNTYTGVIADSSCANNVHSLSRSHKEMLRSKAFGSTDAECARNCVRHYGSSFVLVHKNEVYSLDNQVLADKFAGQTVKIEGTLDTASKTIHVLSMDAD